jgi:hypothetical protein
VRALLGAAARGPRPVSFFNRRGADCLGKYMGEAERSLRWGGTNVCVWNYINLLPPDAAWKQTNSDYETDVYTFNPVTPIA